MKYSILFFLVFIIIFISCNKDNIQIKKEISTEYFTTDNSNIAYNSIRKLSVDQGNQKWYLAVKGYGYYLYGFEDEPTDTILKIQLGVGREQANGCYYCGSDVPMFTFDSNNNLWISYYAYNYQGFTNWEKDELRVRKDGEWEKIENKPTTFEKINMMVEEGANNYWFGGPHGIGHYKNNQWALINKANSVMTSNTITGILIDEESTKLIGSHGGLIKIKGDEIQLFNSENTSLTSDAINGLFMGANNEIFVYTEKEVFEFINNDFSFKLTLPNYDSNFRINVDNNYVMWMTGRFDVTTKGLSCYNGVDWDLIIEKRNQLSLLSTTADKENKIWVGSNQGLIRIIY